MLPTTLYLLGYYFISLQGQYSILFHLHIFQHKNICFCLHGRKIKSLVSTARARVPVHANKFCNAHDAPLTQSTVENTLI